MQAIQLIEEFKNFQQVRAIAIGGSCAAKTFDEKSDIDVYVFVESDIKLSDRENFVKKYSTNFEVGGEYFGTGDEFFVDELNKQFDVMYWNVTWFEDIVENVWVKHYPANAYTTAFLYTLDTCEIVYDNSDWLKNLKNKLKSNYPQELKQNIIKRNMMLMYDKPFASYYEQIKKAMLRNDVNSINHRIAAFLASYFDVIFALNEILHPGEKRLIAYAKNYCKILPDSFEENINNLLVQPNSNTLSILEDIMTNLKKVCKYDT